MNYEPLWVPDMIMATEIIIILKQQPLNKRMHELYNLYRIPPVKPEGQAQGCILMRSTVINPLGNDSPVRI